MAAAALEMCRQALKLSNMLIEANYEEESVYVPCNIFFAFSVSCNSERIEDVAHVMECMRHQFARMIFRSF